MPGFSGELCPPFQAPDSPSLQSTGPQADALSIGPRGQMPDVVLTTHQKGKGQGRVGSLPGASHALGSVSSIHAHLFMGLLASAQALELFRLLSTTHLS